MQRDWAGLRVLVLPRRSTEGVDRNGERLYPSTMSPEFIARGHKTVTMVMADWHQSAPNNVFPKIECAPVSETCLIYLCHVPEFKPFGMRRVPQQRHAPQDAEPEHDHS